MCPHFLLRKKTDLKQAVLAEILSQGSPRREGSIRSVWNTGMKYTRDEYLDEILHLGDNLLQPAEERLVHTRQ